MTDFLDQQYRLPPAVYPPNDLGIDRGALPRAVAPVPLAPSRAIVPVFDSRPMNTVDIDREYQDGINFTVPQGYTFVLRRIKVASYSDSAMSLPAMIESGLRLNITVNGINSLLTDTNYGFASNFDTPVFLTVPELQSLGGNVSAAGQLIPGVFNAWSARTLVNDTWGGIAETNGIAVFVSQNGSNFYTTMDGVTLSNGTLPFTVTGVAGDHGYFMATDSVGALVAISTNGYQWGVRAAPAQGICCAGGNGRFILVAGGYVVYMTTDNGISWNAGNALPGAVGNTWKAYWDGSQFIIKTAGGANIQFYTSPDGVVWTLKHQQVQTATTTYGIIKDDGVYVTDMNGGLYWSTDLVTWTLGQALNGVPNVADQANFVAYAGGLFRTANTTNNVSYQSVDGKTWTVSNAPTWGVNIGSVGDTFFIMGGAEYASLISKTAAQISQGGFTMKYAISGQLIPNSALPSNMAARG